MFLHEFGKIEAEAFLTLASELVEDDGIVTPEEDAMLAEYAAALGISNFTYDCAACAAARDTLAQLNEVSKRKVYMEMFSFAICDGFEDPAERRSLNTLRDALELDAHICRLLETGVQDLYGVYAQIEHALEADPSPITVEKEFFRRYRKCTPIAGCIFLRVFGSYSASAGSVTAMPFTYPP